jgi:hypothetical protein
MAEGKGGLLVVADVSRAPRGDWLVYLAVVRPDSTVSREDSDVMVVTEKQAEGLRLLLARAEAQGG